MEKIFEQMEAIVIDFYKLYNNYCAENNRPVLSVIDANKQKFVNELAANFDEAHQGENLTGYTFESGPIRYHINRVYSFVDGVASGVVCIYNALCKLEHHKKITPTSPEVSEFKTFTIASDEKLDIYKFCSKDKMRPQMAGVYLNHGQAVATDAHVLIVAPANYPENRENTVISKLGETVAGRYPNYRGVINCAEEVQKIDLSKYSKTIEAAAVACRGNVEEVLGYGSSKKTPAPIIINDGVCLDLRKGSPFEKVLKLAKKYQVFLYIDSRRNTAVLFTAHDKKSNKYIAGGICMPIRRTEDLDFNITLDCETVDGLEVRETILNCGARLEDTQTAAQAAEAPAVEDSTLEDVQTAPQAAEAPAVEDSTLEDVQTAAQAAEVPAVEDSTLEDVQTVPQAAEAPAVEDNTLEDVQTAAQAAEAPAVEDSTLEDVQTAAQAAEVPAVEDSTLEDVQTAAQADNVPAVASDDSQPDQLPEPPAVVYVSEPCPPTPRRRRRGFRPATFRRPFSRVAASLLVFVVAVALSLSWPPVEGVHATAAAVAAVTLPEVTVTADVMPAPQEGTQPGTIDSPTADHANNGSTSHALTAAQDGQTAALAAELPAVEDHGQDDGQPGTIDSPAADYTSDGSTLAPAAASGSAPCWYTCTASYNSPATHVYPLS